MTNQEHNTFWDKAQAIDRRWIFLLIGLSVVIPMAFDVRLPTPASTEVETIFDRIEEMPQGSNVLVSFDFDPPSRPELRPMAMSYMRHLALRGHRVYTMALWPMGQAEARDVIELLYPMPATVEVSEDEAAEGEAAEGEAAEGEAAEGEAAQGNEAAEAAEGDEAVVVEVREVEFPDFEYGTNYMMLGYRPGDQSVIQVILNDLRAMYDSDFQGTPLTEIPMMSDITNLRDMDLLLNVSAGYPGLKEWVQFGGDPSNVPIAGGVTAVSAPLLYPYYPAQLFGLMGGIQAAAEYESLIWENYGCATNAGTEYAQAHGHDCEPYYADLQNYDGVGRMTPQTFAHMVIIFFIIVGKIAFFATLRGRSRERLKSLQS